MHEKTIEFYNNSYFHTFMILQKLVRVGERGQIVIPKAIRTKEGISPNDVVEIIDLAGEIKIRTLKQMQKTPEQDFLQALQEIAFTEEDWIGISKERHEE